MIHVVAAVLGDARGRILIARRPAEAHQGGLWEFPGGKLEPGEEALAGLRRELAEELGIQVQAAQPWKQIRHDYGDRRIMLDVYRVTAFAGVPRGCEGQALAWAHPRDLRAADFPAADRPVIAALRLPPLYAITGAIPDALETFDACLVQALERGAGLVQLRAHALDDPAYARLAERAFAQCERRGAGLVLNRDPGRARALPAHGLHLRGRQLAILEQRPQGSWEWVGASCHTPEELARAAALGLDYALLSPVQPTTSHVGVRPLGWRGFADLVARATLPIYGLGGLQADDLETARAQGAQGIAAIRGFWSCGGTEARPGLPDSSGTVPEEFI